MLTQYLFTLFRIHLGHYSLLSHPFPNVRRSIQASGNTLITIHRRLLPLEFHFLLWSMFSILLFFAISSREHRRKDTGEHFRRSGYLNTNGSSANTHRILDILTRWTIQNGLITWCVTLSSYRAFN